MPIPISRLRRWFAIGAITLVLMVAGAYFYARHRVQNALKQVPGKIGVDIQQTAQGFTISRSAEGHTIFKVQASRAIQFKQGGRTELHDVTITLYGQDSSRFDQIYGQSFEYDPQTGDVTGKGQVEIDLEANPQGALRSDQTPPKELKNPIHLATSDLVFNQKTGNAYTKSKVDFRIPQARGSAVGVAYDAKTHVLTLQSDIAVQFAGPTPATVTALHGVITKEPRAVVLSHPHVVTSSQDARAEQATLYLRPDNTLDRVVANGNVELDAKGAQPGRAHAEKLELLMATHRDILKTAILSGGVQVQHGGTEPMEGSAGRVILTFSGKNLVSKVRAEDAVKLVQHRKPSSGSAAAQDIELTAPAVDLYLAGGRHLQRAETQGAGPQIAIGGVGPGSNAGHRTVVNAGEFQAHFDGLGRLTSLHGAPEARITTASSNPGQPDRVSTSQTLDATFRPGSGIEEIVQQGNFAYVDGERKAWAERARYTLADQILTLSGSPRVTDGGMTTTANSMRINRTTGYAIASGDVKSTYSDVKPQPNGALLASSSPIHVTSASMTAHRTPAIAVYMGNARLWQDANIVEAPSIQFDRDRRSVVAQGSSGQKVSAVLVQVDKRGKATPVTITSSRLSYTDSERKVQFEGGVTAKGEDATMSADRMDVYLAPRGQPGSQPLAQAAKLDKIVAQGHVVVSQPNRYAQGDQLTYVAGEDKFVMTGGFPSIFDAEHGKITGVSLTFFRHDDRVLVEGNDTNPTVTHTRVAR